MEESQETIELNTSFDAIVAQDILKDYFKTVLKSGRFSNTYIISGPEGSGKRMMAEAFSAGLLCENREMAPCGECLSCRKFKHRNHPDFVEITHEKPKRITVDEVRTQLVSQIDTPAVEGKNRIYLMEQAELMGVEAQNAILKTIEEPPKHAIILLLTSNADAFLQTIRSRAVELEMKSIPEDTIEKYLMNQYGLSEQKARTGARFSQGNIGQALLLATSEEFAERKNYVVKLISDLQTEPEYMIEALVKKVCKDCKEEISDVLNLIQIWYRDVLLYKATDQMKYVIFQEELSLIQRQAEDETYDHLNDIFEEIRETRARLKANMKDEAALNLLLLVLKGENK